MCIVSTNSLLACSLAFYACFYAFYAFYACSLALPAQPGPRAPASRPLGLGLTRRRGPAIKKSMAYGAISEEECYVRGPPNADSMRMPPKQPLNGKR